MEEIRTGAAEHSVCADEQTKTADPDTLSGHALAYLGDAVLELLVRTYLVGTGISHAGELNARARTYVTAAKQSAGTEALLPLLDEQEEAVYRRGRNAAGSHPRSASVAEYRRATGMEALFGWLYLHGRMQRLNDLFSVYRRAAETGEGSPESSAENGGKTL